MAIHALVMLFVKMVTSAEFRARDNLMKKVLHVIQNLSLATPYQDWDEGVHTVPEYKRRFRRTNIEMACCLTLNILVSLVMLVPLWYTGELRSTNYHNITCISQATKCTRGTVS